MKQIYEGYMAHVPCPECGGKRLKREALAVTVGGKSIAELSDMSIDRARAFLANAELTRAAEDHRQTGLKGDRLPPALPLGCGP